ncbi:MAG: alanine racemase [Melioribacteraceae bacterium]|nr:alanine racemase [Melioribacteraceae bacterium]MCF8354728.1 alanine racemase [Melioribacteraceae bacterium]MCF8394357.1 alanine racemase [Melioribacteraceae bacterium]MCF8420067.1 alanine racemase [Melioribacteraceae bacterium]
MATLTVHTDRLIDNISKLTNYLNENDIEFTLVTKLLSGHKPTLEKLMSNPVIKKLHSVGDSRISNLRTIKEINPSVVTMYIKPPAMVLVKKVIQYADISLNSSETVIQALDKEAKRQGKIHRVIVMIEMGELREGVVRDNVLSFYEKVFNLSNIQIIGLGTNLGCMYGIEPTYDKMIQLSLYKQLIDAKFGTNLELVSSGSSITLPLISKNKLPAGVNHFRIGETAFLGTSPYNNKKFRNLSTTGFDFSAEILELEKKDRIPDGKIGEGNIGHTAEGGNFENVEDNESYRAIVDFGELDVDVNNITTKDKHVTFFGTTSDMTVYDLGQKKYKYKVGGQIHFTPNYMATARLMNSRYVSKKII